MRTGRLRGALTFVVLSVCFFAGAQVASADYRSAVMSDGPANYFRMGEAGDYASNMINEVPGELWGYHDNVPLKDIPGALEQESPNLSVGYRESPNLDQSYFPITYALFSYDSFSIEFFVWTGAEPLPPGVTQWYDGYGLVDGEISGVTSDAGTAIVEGGRVGFGMGSPDTTIISQKAVNDGFWHHVVATHVGGGLMRLYVDGILEAETGSGPTEPRTNSEFSVGALLTGVGQFPGLLDEVAFYRHALNATDVVEHYTASGRQANIPKSSIPVYLAGGGKGAVLGPNNQRCPDACNWEAPFGTRSDFYAYPAPGSRFGFFKGNCVQDTADSCYVFADYAFEWVEAFFFPEPKALAQGLKVSTPRIAKILEGALDDCVSIRTRTKTKCRRVSITGADLAPGATGGALITIDGDGGALIGPDGASLIGPDGASLIGPDGASMRLIGPDGASLINRGLTLVGTGSNTFTRGNQIISDNGGGRVQLASLSARKKKPKIYVLGSYSAATDGVGTFKANFNLTKKGKGLFKAIKGLNVARHEDGMKAYPLPATFVQVLEPLDGTGTGGSFTQLEIK